MILLTAKMEHLSRELSNIQNNDKNSGGCVWTHPNRYHFLKFSYADYSLLPFIYVFIHN